MWDGNRGVERTGLVHYSKAAIGLVFALSYRDISGDWSRPVVLSHLHFKKYGKDGGTHHYCTYNSVSQTKI